MTTVKIISDPYRKQIAYQWKVAGSGGEKSRGQWIDVNEMNNPNSKLLRDKFIHGFFPFQVDRIVDAIVDEYEDANGKVSLEFEGMDDEFSELKLVCDDEPHRDAVTLTRSEKKLDNARNILPEITGIFQDLRL